MNSNTKLAFFDLDYTLSDSRFRLEDGSIVNGMHHEKWIQYCKEYGSDTYNECKVVPVIAYYADDLKKNGAELFVLGAINDEIEIPGKIKFIEERYEYLFDLEHIIFVKGYGKSKAQKIKEIAEKKKVNVEDCELIEDDYGAVLAAIDEGIKGTHVTKIFNDFFNRLVKKNSL